MQLLMGATLFNYLIFFGTSMSVDTAMSDLLKGGVLKYTFLIEFCVPAKAIDMSRPHMLPF